MPMHDPLHPGALIRQELEHLGYSTAEAAEALGVTRQHLHKIITGRGNLTPDMALRLERAIGGTADAWLRMQGHFDLSQLRKQTPDPRVRRLQPKAA